MNPDSFEPKKAKLKFRVSSTKRVAMIIFVGMAVLMLVVMTAITNSGNHRQGSEPIKLFEASGGTDAGSLEKMAKTPPVPPDDDITPSEDYSASPMYYDRSNISSVSEKRKDDQVLRLLAANSRSAIDGFGNIASTSAIATKEVAQTEEQLGVALQTDATTAAHRASLYNADIVSQQKNSSGVGRDPNGWDAKDKFVNERGKLSEGYSAHFRTPPISELEIKAGTIIPCVLISGVNSDLPGNSIGQVAEDVWDSATGRHLLIPKGSKVVGTYDNRISYGQSRVLIVWSKIVYPDGSTLMLENLSAADQSGYTGAKGPVNRHWNSIISSALIVSLLGAGVDVVSPQNNDGKQDTNDARTVVAQNAARAVAEAMSNIINREVNRQPTIKIRPGYRFILFVRQDMLFGQAWS